MSKLQRLLFPLDLSLNYPTLTATTRRMFDRRSIEIVMLHAIEEPSRSGRGMEVERSMAQLEFLTHKEFEFAQVCRRVERGRAADCILDYARNHAVDVIVMPPGGSESLRRNSLGHMTDEALTEAPCAVWMEWMTGLVERLRHVFCAVRLDGFDEVVLCRATEVAEKFGAELTIIHAVSPEPQEALGGTPIGVRRRFALPGCTWTNCARNSLPPRACTSKLTVWKWLSAARYFAWMPAC